MLDAVEEDLLKDLRLERGGKGSEWTLRDVQRLRNYDGVLDSGLLLQPIELLPPSYQYLGTSPIQTSQSEPISSLRGVDPLLQEASPVASAVRHKPSASPQQSASLGRSTHPPKDEGSNVAMSRRNPLGDLKIQVGIS